MRDCRKVKFSTLHSFASDESNERFPLLKYAGLPERSNGAALGDDVREKILVYQTSKNASGLGESCRLSAYKGSNPLSRIIQTSLRVSNKFDMKDQILYPAC